LLSNPIPNLRPSRRLLRTFIRILKQGYRLRAYVEIVIGDVVVRVGGDVEPERLAAVIRAVRQA